MIFLLWLRFCFVFWIVLFAAARVSALQEEGTLCTVDWSSTLVKFALLCIVVVVVIIIRAKQSHIHIARMCVRQTGRCRYALDCAVRGYAGALPTLGATEVCAVGQVCCVPPSICSAPLLYATGTCVTDDACAAQGGTRGSNCNVMLNARCCVAEDDVPSVAQVLSSPSSVSILTGAIRNDCVFGSRTAHKVAAPESSDAQFNFRVIPDFNESYSFFILILILIYNYIIDGSFG